MTSSHDTLDDPRNQHVLVWLNGALVPRERAVVSVLDAGFLLGDGVWESFRVHRGRALFVGEHLERLFEGLAAIDLDPRLTGAWMICRNPVPLLLITATAPPRLLRASV